MSSYYCYYYYYSCYYYYYYYFYYYYYYYYYYLYYHYRAGFPAPRENNVPGLLLVFPVKLSKRTKLSKKTPKNTKIARSMNECTYQHLHFEKKKNIYIYTWKTTFWPGSWPRQWSLKFRTSVVTRYHVKTDGIPWWSCWSWPDVWHIVFFAGKVYLQFWTRVFPTFRNLICFLDQEVEHSEMMRLVEVVWFGHGCQMTCQGVVYWAFQRYEGLKKRR